MKYSLGIAIGRFQPVHDDHIKQIIIPALEQCDRVLVILGSCHKPRTIKDPFTVSERVTMIRQALYEYGYGDDMPLYFKTARDFPYDNNRWRAQNHAFAHEFETNDRKIALFGAEKDASSFYLKLFPLWTLVESQGLGNGYGATSIREMLLNITGYSETAIYTHLVKRGVPVCNIDFLTDWMRSKTGQKLQTEYNHIIKYRQQFEDYPYPPIFHTVDNVVLYNGYILLVRRGAAPGKGLWALPGGFLNANEWTFQAAMRELKEETGLKAKPEWYNPSGVIFDHPQRSLRGRTITTAFLCIVPSRFDAPTVKGMDDADKASWFPLDQVLGDNPQMSDVMFEDHIDIIREMVERA